MSPSKLQHSHCNQVGLCSPHIITLWKWAVRVSLRYNCLYISICLPMHLCMYVHASTGTLLIWNVFWWIFVKLDTPLSSCIQVFHSLGAPWQEWELNKITAVTLKILPTNVNLYEPPSSILSCSFISLWCCASVTKLDRMQIKFFFPLWGFLNLWNIFLSTFFLGKKMKCVTSSVFAVLSRVRGNVTFLMNIYILLDSSLVCFALAEYRVRPTGS